MKDTQNISAISPPPFVLTQIEKGVATLTLNRGERFNPLSARMINAISEALTLLADEPQARVIVLGGAGRGFCAGHDLKEMRQNPSTIWQKKLFDDCNRLMMQIVQQPQPIIARVHGIATAAGCQLVSMCDLAVASTEAKFALPGVNLGLFCSTPAVGVARNIGRKHAMEMLLTGNMIDAPTALEWGLVNRVVPAESLDTTIAEWCDSIKTKSSAAIAMGKGGFYQQMDLDLPHAYQLAGQVMACNMNTHDAAEGIDAFLGKRPPEWRGC